MRTESYSKSTHEFSHRKPQHTRHLKTTIPKPQKSNLLLSNKHKLFKYAFQDHFLFSKPKPYAYLKSLYKYLKMTTICQIKSKTNKNSHKPYSHTQSKNLSCYSGQAIDTSHKHLSRRTALLRQNYHVQKLLVLCSYSKNPQKSTQDNTHTKSTT